MVLMLGGLLFSVINPEIVAGHSNYVGNYHLLSLVKNMSFWASVAVVVILWLLVCFLVIRSKERSSLWLFFAALAPFGFAVLATAETDRHARFVRRRLRSVHLRGHMAACLSGHGSQAQSDDHV